MKIKFKKLHPDAKLPTKSEGNIGWDLYYCGEEKGFYPGELVLLETGISWEPEIGYHGLIWDRSGLSVKHQLHRVAGVIDNSYRGEIKVALKYFDRSVHKPSPPPKKCETCGHIEYAYSIPVADDGLPGISIKTQSVPVLVKKGDRIAQLIIQKEIPTEVGWAEELTETERGEGGFGSSGR